MSDLAPYVAAVLRDKVVCDLLEENEALREQNRATREQNRATQMVAVTGQDGAPIYAQGNFEEDGQAAEDPSDWQVQLSQLAPAPLSALRGLEIHFGGVRLALIHQESFSIITSRESTVSFWVWFHAGFWLDIIVGPVTAAEQVALTNSDGDDTLVDSIMRAFAEDIEGKTMTFPSILLLDAFIRGALVNFPANAGRRAEEPDEDDEGVV